MSGFGSGSGGFESFEVAGGRIIPCYRPPVPPLPALDEVWASVEEARWLVDAFDRALAAFPVPGVVGRLFARLDAVHSSGAEGATTTFTDLLEYQSSPRRARDPEDAGSVAGCAAAFDDLQGGLGDMRAAVLAIHRRLLAVARDPYVAAQAGHWKTVANATMDADAATGFFYYTSPASLHEALSQWQAFTLADGGPELVRQALSHWMFEHIHPVGDGNGRVGRLMVPLTVMAKGMTGHACCFLGEAVHANTDIYVEALKRGRRTGDMGAWARVFLSLVAQTAGLNLDRLARLGEVHDRWRKATRTVRAHSAVHALVPWIVTRPAFTVRDALAGLGRGTFASINGAIARLGDLGIVQPSGLSARDRLFTAPEVIGLFEIA
jgi:hypothetical protein